MNRSSIPLGLQRRNRHASLVPATAALLLAMGLGSNAQASPCLAEAAGNPALNCTANDFGVGSVTVNSVLDDGCQFEGDTFTFNGTLNLTASNASRYDVGFYIGGDGDQAYTGSCTVGLIPPGTSTANDGDACGDFDGTPISVPIQNVTSVCTDTNNDGFFDLAMCTSWDNNTRATCNGIEDAIPGTSAKCACTQVETTQPVPEPVDPTCLTNADCTSDNNVCTDEVCNVGGPGADLFGCTHPVNTASCDNGLFCDGADVCTGGTCGHAGDPCVGGGVCGDTCNEAGDTCFDASGTVCRAAAGACDVAESCTGTSGACPSDAFLTSTCRASTGVCDAAETCSGSSATCPADAVATAGTICRGSAGSCDVAETCTGTSNTCPADGLATAGTTCRSAAGSCDVAETCTGTSNACPADAFTSTGTICRSDAGDCDVAETCTGTSGACPANGFNPTGTACTTDDNACTDDLCNATGGCTHASNTAPCDDGLFCTVGDACTGGACGGTARDCTDSIACSVGSCDEGTNACVQVGNNTLCNDADDCTMDSCAIAEGGCVSENICGTDICRSPGYWSTHSGYEKPNSINVTQELLDAVGPLEVCGETISATSNEDAPYLEGLGLTSDLEGLCMRSEGVKQRQLYRQLLAAALNCAVSGGDCDAILAKYIDVSFTECSNLCEGLEPVEGAPTAGQCVRQLDCFNNGGQVIDGDCAFGTCAGDSSLYCGSDYGDCPLVDALPQECVDFANNCHDADLCNEDIGFCPTNTRASSPKACKEARSNDCTIDSCN